MMRTRAVPKDDLSDETDVAERIAKLREQSRNHQAHLKQINAEIEELKSTLAAKSPRVLTTAEKQESE